MQPDWQRDINQALGKNYTWEPFAKGSSNTLYRGCLGKIHNTDAVSNTSIQESCILLRQNAAKALTPGVNRQREAALLSLISEQNWAPNIIENHPVGCQDHSDSNLIGSEGWCAMTLYQPIPTDHTLTETQQSQLIEAVAQLQQITTNTHLTDQQIELLTVDYDELWDTTYLPQAQARNDQVALNWIDEIKRNLHDLPDAPLSLVHHDLHMGNLVLKPYNQDHEIDSQQIGAFQQTHQLIILDWEYGGLGNPWLDAAALVNFFKLSPQRIATLPAFQHHTTNTFNQGLMQAIEIRDLINKLWYRARGEVSLDEAITGNNKVYYND